MFQDHHGDIWMGTKSKGIYRLKPTHPALSNDQTGKRSIPSQHFQVEHFLLPDNPHGNNAAQVVYALAEDKQQRLWVGTYGGVSLIISKNLLADNLRMKN
jgi:ligand-binding sensor domain-containing protein